MAERVVAPDCFDLVRDVLEPVGVPLSSRLPNPLPPEFGRITPVPSVGFTGRALFAGRVVVEFWAASQFRALELARLAESYLSAPQAGLYADCAGPGVYPPDPTTGRPKAGFTADVFARGSLIN